ncbi:hypothetical protein STEG23_015472 [Scotinomys teguina]
MQCGLLFLALVYNSQPCNIEIWQLSDSEMVYPVALVAMLLITVEYILEDNLNSYTQALMTRIWFTNKPYLIFFEMLEIITCPSFTAPRHGKLRADAVLPTPFDKEKISLCESCLRVKDQRVPQGSKAYAKLALGNLENRGT